MTINFSEGRHRDDATSIRINAAASAWRCALAKTSPEGPAPGSYSPFAATAEPTRMESSASASSSRSPSPLPAAASLFRLHRQTSSPDSSADASRLLPRLVPLMPRRPDAPTSPQWPLAPATPTTSQSLFGFMGLRKLTTPYPTAVRALPDASPRSVAVATPEDEKEPAAKRRRHREELDEATTPGKDSDAPPRRRKRSNSSSKGRKPTYLLRKEEKDELVEKIRELQTQVLFLQQRDTPGLHGDSTPGIARHTDRKLFEQEMRNRLLREATRNHHFQLFSAQSALSELTHTMPHRCPIDTFIRLGRDCDERRAALQAIKAQKLRDAKQLMARRTQFLSASAEPCRETSQFATNAGSLCSLQFDVVPLDAGVDVDSVTRVFDAACGYVQSLESALFTKSIDDKTDGLILGQLELTTTPEMPTETNFVVFSELLGSTRDGGKTAATSREEQKDEVDVEPLAVLVVDSVNEDELHPYRPREFLRLDMNAVVMLTRRPLCGQDASTKQQDGLVLTRWALLTAYPSEERPVPTGAVEVISQAADFMNAGMLQAINKACMSSTIATATGNTTVS